MQKVALDNPKIEVIWNREVLKAFGNERGLLSKLNLQNIVTSDESVLAASGLFFAIGHEQATKFLEGHLELDSDGYIVTKPGTTNPEEYCEGFGHERCSGQEMVPSPCGCVHKYVKAFNAIWHLLSMVLKFWTFFISISPQYGVSEFWTFFHFNFASV